MKSKKRGVFFSTDAILALSIIFIVMLIAFPLVKQTRSETNLHYDILTTLSSLHVGEIPGPSSYLKTDENNTVLEQIGEFYAKNQKNLAEELADFVLEDIETNENIGLWYGSNLIWSKNTTPYGPSESKNIQTARQTISGIQNGTNITGFAARAFLSSSARSKYFYFGGYVGDGNITARIQYDGNISSATFEGVVSDNFTLYVNENFIQNYNGSQPDEFTPVKYSIPVNDFVSGAENLIEFRGNNLHLAGGFIKIAYQSDVEYPQITRHYFPGVNGLINVYDGFYIPGSLAEMSIYLRLNSTLVNTTLNIGDTNIWNGTTDGIKTLYFDDNFLSSKLNYASLSRSTIPLRLGLENVSLLGQTEEIDLYSVFDLSSSMGAYTSGYLCSYSCDSVIVNCSVSSQDLCIGDVCQQDCFSTSGHTTCQNCYTLLDAAKDANEELIESILTQSPDNRVGLQGFGGFANDTWYHPLSNNQNSLVTELNSWPLQSATAICRGIDRANLKMNQESAPDKFKTMIVMSDGDPTVICGGIFPEEDYDQDDVCEISCIDVNPPDGICETGCHNVTQDPEDDAIQASCNAWENDEIRVYVISFGELADTDTMQKIAECGNGLHFNASDTDITTIYQQVAQSIITAFIEQSIEIEEGELFTQVFHDSYIEFNYTAPITPTGLIITAEKQFENPSAVSFSIPSDASLLETNVISYSGPRWTNFVGINGLDIYNLSKYQKEYTLLGDPYSVNIPNENVTADGSLNNIVLTTGVDKFSPSSPGSINNKVIYTIAKDISAFSPITYSADGCTWHIQFEDDTNITLDIPEGAAGGDCYYQPGYTSGGEIANDNDASQIAVRNILRELDLDNPWNNKIDVQFTEQDLAISLSEIDNIPLAWSTEVQVRIWD